jgi:hypothetical protein
MTAAVYTLSLTADADPGCRVRAAFRVERLQEPGLKHQLGIAAAVAADASSFLHALTRAEQQVLRSELLAGLLTGCRGQWTGWRVELLSLGAETGASRTIADAASVAYAVAATLVLRHATGAEDLIAHPRGGYGWRLTGFTQA